MSESIGNEAAIAEGVALAQQSLDALRRLTDTALTDLSPDALLDELLERISEIIGSDTAAILLLDGTQGELVARAASGLEATVNREVRVPLGQGFAGRVAAERRPIVIEDVDQSGIVIVNPILREQRIKSLLGVPLMVQGRVLGVLHVGTREPRFFTRQDVALLQLAAERAALAIDRARLVRRERVARREARESTEVVQNLLRVTDSALAHLSLEDLLHQLLERISEVIGSDTAAILLLDEQQDELVARAAKGIEEEVRQGVRIPAGHGFAGRVAAERRAVVIEDIDRADIYNPILRQKGIKSLLGVPLLVEGRVLGVLHVGALRHRLFDAKDIALLELAAERAAVAIDRAQLVQKRTFAEVLQKTLLPTSLPSLPGIEMAARYIAPVPEADIGGDWYDVIVMPDGRVGFVIGDVMGRGVDAAVLMAELRTALRAYAMEGIGLNELMDRLNALLVRSANRRMATALLAVLDEETGSLSVVNAGHPPPLLHDATGTRYLSIDADLALGCVRNFRYQEQQFSLPEEALLLLYTDGLVERRDSGIDRGLDLLRDSIADAGQIGASAAAQRVIARLLNSSEDPDDDVALLAIRLTPIGERFSLSLAADPDELVVLRRYLRRWLRGVGADEGELYDLTLACQEAAANVVAHAYGPGEAKLRVDCEATDDGVSIEVIDEGRWRPPEPGESGHGLALIEALVDSTSIDTGEFGTRVRLTRRLRAAEGTPR